MFPSIHFSLLHSCAYKYGGTHTHTHVHHAPDNHQRQGTLYCFSSMLITSGLDPRFSQRAAEGDGVDVDVCVCVRERRERSVCVCVLGEGLAGWRGHCCCQSIVTQDSPKYHSIIQDGKHSSTMRPTNQHTHSQEIPDPNMPD